MHQKVNRLREVSDLKKRVALIHLFWLGVMIFLSYRMPYMTDDYLHMNSFATGEKISSVGMLFPSVWTYYISWGGRALSMVVIQTVLQLPRIVYSILNALIYVSVAGLICQYGRLTAKTGHDDVLTASVYLILWFFMPSFAEDVFWTTGSITYLWMNLVVLSFGFVYYRDYLKVRDASMARPVSADVSSDERSVVFWVIRFIGMLIFGFCAGLTNETSACTLICALAAYTVYMIRSHRKIKADRIAGMAGTILGAGVLLLAPGNFVRADTVAQYDSVIMRFGFRLARETYYFVMLLTVPVLLCITLRILVRERNGSEIFMILAFISVYVMTFSVVFSTRILQMTLFLIAIGISVSLAGLRIHMSDTVSLAVRIFLTGLLATVIIETATGVVMSGKRDSFFERRMQYYYSLEELVGGIIGDER